MSAGSPADPGSGLAPTPGGAPAARPPGPPRPDRSAAEIRRDVEVTRSELSQSVDALRSKVGELTDWRRQIREHRTELIVGAAAAGFVIGGLMALRRRRR